MEKLPGFNLSEKISETRNSIVYRANRDEGNERVVIKILNTMSPSSSEIARFKQEFELIRNIDLDGVINAYEIKPYNGGYAIILEDFNGVSLKEIIKEKNKIAVKLFLGIAIKVTEALGQLHKDNIIHRDIKPANILINLNENQVKITDFGISKVLTREDEELYHPEVIEGTLVYMSPEQTGRMNRTIDYRTDLYSLGITFYEMLTGNLPFKSKDPMEIVHSHIAITPVPPNEVDSSIPEVISNIIMKLLLKTPEERYQNGFGIMADLKECHEQFKSKGEIKSFTIAQKDISEKFIVPQVIYGREKEIETLIHSFERASTGGSELMLVTGPPGIGKSALINEIHKPIVAKSGYFISGKYEEFRRDVPYNAILQAFNGLIDQILTESGERIEKWARDLTRALGASGKYVTDSIPRLELVIGKQQAGEEIEGDEARNLFNRAFKNLVMVFASEKHPLVMFLDDLQWIDAASLTLIRNLITDPDIKYLLLIATYRDNEVDETHSLTTTLKKIEKAGTKPNNISVSPLTGEMIQKLISTYLRMEKREAAPLAEIIHKKTNGNPFFVNQFLKTIYDSKLMEIDPGKGWKIDIVEIKNLQVTDNVVKLMTEKIITLPAGTQEILKVGACIGNRFDLETLSVILNTSIDETLSRLTIAIDEGLVSLFGDMYRFHHDRIQEAAYSLLSDEEKMKKHYQIGNLLLENTSEEELDNKILYVVSQLNSGKDLASTKEEIYKLTELNLRAARKAKRSGAFESSLTFLKKGIEIFGENNWENKYDLSLRLFTETAITLYRSNNPEEMEKVSQVVLENSRDVLDKLRIYELKILASTNQYLFEDAIQTGLEVLKLLDINFPKSPGKLTIKRTYLKLKPYLSEKKIKSLGKLPDMTDQYKIAAIRIMMRLILPTMATSLPLLILILFKSSELSIKYGLHNESGGAFATTGAILCSVFGDTDRGYTLCKEAMSIYKGTKYENGILYLFNSTVRYWKEHLRDSLNPLMEIHSNLLQSGDIQTSALSVTVCAGAIYTGRELNDLKKEFVLNSSILTKMKFPLGVLINQIYMQQIENLTGVSKHRSRLAGEIFNFEKFLPILENFKASMLICIGYLHEVIASYYYGEYEQAAESADLADKYIDSVMVIHVYPYLTFYTSLARLAAYSLVKPAQQKQLLKKIKKGMAKMKGWAHHAPMNFLHKFHILEAEFLRVQSNNKAADLYDMAVEGALENEYIQDAALASEFAAYYWLNKSKKNIARTYMDDAVRFYSRWGAEGKVKDLKEKYPSLIIEQQKTKSKSDIISDTVSDSATETNSVPTTSTMSLDISTIIKTSQTLAGEIALDKLLENIMRLSIKNAGAQKGFLILENEEDGNLYIEAEGRIDEIEVLQSVPVETSNDLSPAIINYVYKTKENLVLNNAQKDDKFANDSYIVNNKSKSVLCSPIIHKGKMSGILYLENSLTTDAFTPERIEILHILSAQAAISIENSRLLSHRENAAKLETEMQIAANIQISLLPKNPAMDGFEISAYLKSADDVGGDYYDFINIGDKTWVIIGDVSGHGVPAGLVMMMVQTSIQLMLKRFPDITPSTLLNYVNEVIRDNIHKMEEDKYMTITVFCFDIEGKALFSGLHQEIIIYRAESAAVDIIPSEGIWISPWEMGHVSGDAELKLNSGDILFLYTDGITEAANEENNYFSMNRLVNVIKASGNLPPDGIKDSVLNSLQGYEPDDDVTMVVLKKI